MTVHELAELVKRLRDVQRTFFRTRASEVLAACKGLEREVDAAVASVLSGPGLFDEPVTEGET